MPQPITDACAGKTVAERAAIKAAALVDLIQDNLPYEYTINGIDISVLTVTVDAKSRFRVTLTAQDANGYLPVPNYTIGEAFLFYNPPVMKRTSDTQVEESPLEVAQNFVYDAVVTYARNHGWNG